MNTEIELLGELRLPDRYEQLAHQLGPEVANILVAPPVSMLASLRAVAAEVRTRNEGILAPVFGESGTGKTTMAMNLTLWHPTLFAQTLMYSGAIESEKLDAALKEYSRDLPADNRRIVPIAVDHRESNPPSDAELAQIKRFLRTNVFNIPVLILWLETNRDKARTLADRYIEIAGKTAIELPIVCHGPDKNTWQSIAINTLEIANKIKGLEELGVDPRAYNPMEYHTLGAFLRQIAHDFNLQQQKIKASIERPITLAIVVASDSSEPGSIAQITNASRYGLLDPHAMLAISSDSEVGKWWLSRRGLLVRAVVQLNAHLFCLPPAASASCIRNFTDGMPLFESIGYRRYGPARGIRDLGRCDVGKFLLGQELNRFESRGTPADEATAAFELLAEKGFTYGADKKLNVVMAEAIEGLYKEEGIMFEKIVPEQVLPFCRLIPDNAIYQAERITCIEYTWRGKGFLAPGNRSPITQYSLSKLRDYVRALGWTDS